jgi:transcription antitermination factor NusA-like protein
MNWMRGPTPTGGFGPLTEDLNAKRLAFHSGPCWLKLLVPDRVAGSIIGKGGKVISDIEATSGCVMKLSPGQTFFPGTQERIVVIAGSTEGIDAAVQIILGKVRMTAISESRSRRLSGGYMDSDPTLVRPVGEDANIEISIRAVVPNSAVSCIIGRGGEVVKEIHNNTGAMIRIGERMTIVHERIVQVAGTVDQCQAALLEVLTRIQSDRNLKEHLNVVYTKAAMQSNRAPLLLADEAPPGMTSPTTFTRSINQVQTPSGPLAVELFQDMLSGSSDASEKECTISMVLPPGHINTSVFRGVDARCGTRVQFKQQTGCVDISGPRKNVYAAHTMILDLAAQTPSPQFSSESSPNQLYTPPPRLRDLNSGFGNISPPTTTTPSPTSQMRMLPPGFHNPASR